MDIFLNIINVPFVFAIIIIIQIIKALLRKKGLKISQDVWKVIVLFLGIPMALFMSVIEGFVGSWWLIMAFNVILKSFIYSAAASFLYQTGKLIFKSK